VYVVLGLGVPAFAYAVWIIRKRDAATQEGRS
jgi:hypothetical protein